MSDMEFTEADVKALYALDPMAMQAEFFDRFYNDNFTPAHLLCIGSPPGCFKQTAGCQCHVESFLVNVAFATPFAPKNSKTKAHKKHGECAQGPG